MYIEVQCLKRPVYKSKKGDKLLLLIAIIIIALLEGEVEREDRGDKSCMRWSMTRRFRTHISLQRVVV
jgi:hypothetical protein